MKMLSGKVVEGKVVVDGDALVEGALVTVVLEDEERRDWVEVTPKKRNRCC